MPFPESVFPQRNGGQFCHLPEGLGNFVLLQMELAVFEALGSSTGEPYLHQQDSGWTSGKGQNCPHSAARHDPGYYINAGALPLQRFSEGKAPLSENR